MALYIATLTMNQIHSKVCTHITDRLESSQLHLLIRKNVKMYFKLACNDNNDNKLIDHGIKSLHLN